MPYDGLISANFTDHGASRENLLALHKRIGGAYPLVRNSPEMVRLLADAGFRPIYRQTNDDPAANPLARSADDFVKELVANAPDAALYHLTNEIEDHAVHEWTKEALRYANSVTTNAPKLLIYNHATNKSRAIWDACRPNVELAVNTGHAIGVHLYDDLDHLDGAYEWLDLKRAVGGLWMFTEIAYIRSIFDANKGWRNHISDTEYAKLIERHALVASMHNMPTIWYSLEQWPLSDEGKQSGFEFGDNQVILDKMAALNAAYKISLPAPMPTPPTSPPVVIPPTAPLPDWQPRILKASDPRGILRSDATRYADIVFKFNADTIYEVTYDVNGDKADTLLPDLKWQRIVYKTPAGELRGFIRSDAAQLLPEPVSPPPPPVVVEPPSVNVVFTVDELHAIASSLAAIYDANAKIAAQLTAINEEIGNIRLRLADATGRVKATTKAVAA